MYCTILYTILHILYYILYILYYILYYTILYCTILYYTVLYYTCVVSLIYSGSFASDPAGLKSCDCHDACRVSEYSAQLASTKFPSTKYINLYQMPQGDILYSSCLMFHMCLLI